MKLWTLSHHSFLTYAAVKQTDKQIERLKNPTHAERLVGAGNNNIKHTHNSHTMCWYWPARRHPACHCRGVSGWHPCWSGTDDMSQVECLYHGYPTVPSPWLSLARCALKTSHQHTWSLHITRCVGEKPAGNKTQQKSKTKPQMTRKHSGEFKLCQKYSADI